MRRMRNYTYNTLQDRNPSIKKTIKKKKNRQFTVCRIYLCIYFNFRMRVIRSLRCHKSIAALFLFFRWDLFYER